MNKHRLLTIINNPSTIAQGDLDELQLLVDKYPYFQIGHALIAKIKSDNKTLDYRDKLHLAAISTADRNILKNLIDRQFYSEEATEQPETQTSDAAGYKAAPELPEEQPQPETFDTHQNPVEPPEVPAPGTGEEYMEQKSGDELTTSNYKVETADEKTGDTEENTPETPAAATEKEAEETTHLGDLNIRRSSDSDKPKVSITDDTKADKDPKDSLYKELEENLRSLQKRKAKSTPEAASEKAAKKAPTAKKPAAARTTAKKTATTSKTTSSTKTSRTTSKTATSKSTTPATTRTTSGSAKKTTTPKAAAKPQAARTKKTVTSTKTGDKKTAGKTSTGTTKAKSTSAKKTETSKKKLQKTVDNDGDNESKKKSNRAGSDDGKNNQIEIIEEFIKKEPRISKPKLEKGQQNTPQEDLSLKSTEIKEDLVSENLAIIMEKQGKIQKARDIYKKLIWKFPQKKAYFASRIEELERS